MCLPFFHKWEFKLVKEINVYWSSSSTVPMYHKYVYIGTCQKCGDIKRKVIKSG